jgi:hypothetical protein
VVMTEGTASAGGGLAFLAGRESVGAFGWHGVLLVGSE